MIYKLSPRIEESREKERKQTEESSKFENEQLKEQIRFLEKELETTKNERDALSTRYEEEKRITTDKISRLEHENKIITDKLIHKARNIINDVPDSQEEVAERNAKMNIATSLTKSKSSQNIMIGPIGARVLTKKMLLEIIEEIYKSKTNYDKKCAESKMPKETMEQHMYSYLNQKYGLKNLIIEWATSIINGIRMYSTEDSNVLLFGKILRNEIEEDHRYVMAKMKSCISSLLQYFLKAKYPLKSNGDIKEMAQSRMNSFIAEEEWRAIIYQLYKKEDAEILDYRIVDYVRRKYFEHNKAEETK